VSYPSHKRLSATSQKATAVQKPNRIERRLTKFLREPPKVQTAASLIVVATLVVVVGGGALFRLLDHKEYPTIGLGMWFALQTVTTVGYGDLAPKDVAGKLVASLIMLEGIAFLAIITAAITSTFVARAARERFNVSALNDEASESRIETRLDVLQQHLDRLESMIDALAASR
jgi:voltage-gated potassium channel